MEHSGGFLEAVFGVSKIYPDIADTRFPDRFQPTARAVAVRLKEKET